MKKMLSPLCFILILMGQLSYAQNTKNSTRHYCGVNHALDYRLQNEPGYKTEFDALQKKLSKKKGKSSLNRSAINGIYYIPVVFHIISNTGTLASDLYVQFYGSNNNFNRIQDQLDRMNNEFVNSNIQFCLAQKAPPSYYGVPGVAGSWQQITVGNNTYTSTGVTFTPSTTLNTFQPTDGFQVDQMETALPFNQAGENKYLDIYVVDDVRNINYSPVQGEASFGIGFPFDDIAVKMSTVGDDPNSINYVLAPGTDEGKVVVHEVGHWLSLLHTFEDDASCTNMSTDNGDYITDTPPQEGNLDYYMTNYPGLVSGCNASSLAMDCNNTNPLYFNNHMEYAEDACKVSYGGYDPFSFLQNDRMETFIDLFRSDFHSELNLIKTGLANTSCLPITIPFTAEFEIDNLSICEGDAVTLSGMPIGCLGQNQSITSWEFEIDDQINAPQYIGFNGNSDVSATFLAGNLYGPGSYIISLTVNYQDGNNSGSLTYVFPEPLEVLDCSASDLRYTKSFDFLKKSISDLSIVSNGDSNNEEYIIAGTNHLNNGEKQIQIFKVDAAGTIIWQYTYVTEDVNNARCFDIIKNANTLNTYVLTGYVERNNIRQLLVLEIEDQGNAAQITYNGLSPNRARIQSIDNLGNKLNHSVGLEIINTQDGGFAIAGGIADGFSNTDSKMQLLVKLDPSFRIEWIEDFEFTQPGDLFDFDFANSVRELTNYSPNNPNQFRSAYFLGGSKGKRTGGFMAQYQGLSAVIVEDNTTQRNLTPVVNNAWTGPGDDEVIALDVLYEESTNIVYQKCYTVKTHGIFIVKIDPAMAAITTFRELNLLNEGYEYQGLKMIHSNSNQELIIAGLTGPNPCTVKLDKSNWTIYGTSPMGILSNVDVVQYNGISYYEAPDAGPDFSAKLEYGPNKHFYYTPKNICRSAKGGYMYVVPSIPPSNQNPQPKCRLTLLKLDEDLLSGCEFPNIVHPQTQNPVLEVKDPIAPSEAIFSELIANPKEVDEKDTPCSDFCIGDYEITTCHERNGKGYFNLTAGLPGLSQNGFSLTWYSCSSYSPLCIINNPGFYSAQNGDIVYLVVKTPDGCIYYTDVLLTITPPPVANNIVLQANNGVFDLVSAEILVTTAGNTVSWFAGYPPSNPISNPSNYPGPPGPIYALITSPEKCTAIAEVILDCVGLSTNWPKRSIGTEEEHITDIATDLNGNYFVTGYYHGTFDFLGITHTTNSNLPNFFVAKLSECGVEWIKFNMANSYCKGTGVDIDGNGNVYVSGYYRQIIQLGSSQSINLSPQSAFIAKYDSNGNYQWMDFWGTTSNVAAHDVAADGNSNNVYVTGETGGSNYNSYFLRQYDQGTGSLNWNIMNATGTSWSRGQAVDVASTGHIFMTGSVVQPGSVSFNGTSVTTNDASEGMVVKFNSSGAGQIAKSNDFIPKDIIIDASDNAIITGDCHKHGFFFGGPFYMGKVFVAKYSSLLAETWARVGTSSNNALFTTTSTTVAVDQNDDIFIAGLFNDDLRFTGLPNMSNSSWDADMYVAKISSSGTEQWSTHTFSGFQNVAANKLSVALTHEHTDYAYLAGQFNNTINLNSTSLTSVAGAPDLFITSVLDLGNGAVLKPGEILDQEYGMDDLSSYSATENILGIKVFPNPSNGLVKIIYEGTLSGQDDITIYDLSGRKIDKVPFINQKQNLDLSTYVDGIYFIKYQSHIEKVILCK